MMPNNKLNQSRSNFLKANFISLIVGFIITFVLAAILSLVIVKVKCYERFYPAITTLLLCVPSFVGAKLSAHRLNRMLLPLALFHGTATLIVLIAVSGALNGSFANADRFITSAAFTLPSSLLAVFLPARKKNRH